jgi:hypothetical protein
MAKIFDVRTNSTYDLLCASRYGALKACIQGTEDDTSVS